MGGKRPVRGAFSLRSVPAGLSAEGAGVFRAVVADDGVGPPSALGDDGSSARATRAPDSEVSATSARHSRVQLSITRILKRRPSVIWSDTKSKLQRWLAASLPMTLSLPHFARAVDQGAWFGDLKYPNRG